MTVLAAAAPAAADHDESFYATVHAPPFDVPLLKGCWYYPFEWTVHMPTSSSGMLLTGQTHLRDESGSEVGDPVIVDGATSGRHETRICSAGRTPGLFSWAGGQVRFFCTANCPSGQDNASEHGTFIGDQIVFHRPLSAAEMSVPARRPKAGRTFKVNVKVVQGTADLAAPYPKAPVQLQVAQGRRWRDVKGLSKRTTSAGRVVFKVVADAGTYRLRALVEDDGISLPASSVSKPRRVRVPATK